MKERAAQKCSQASIALFILCASAFVIASVIGDAHYWYRSQSPWIGYLVACFLVALVAGVVMALLGSLLSSFRRKLAIWGLVLNVILLLVVLFSVH